MSEDGDEQQRKPVRWQIREQPGYLAWTTTDESVAERWERIGAQVEPIYD